MKFKCDENLPKTACEILKKAGYDATDIWEQKLEGCEDEFLIEKCKKEGRILISLDLDFSDIRTYPPRNSPGIIVLRLKKFNIQQINEKIRQLIKTLVRESPEKKLWIMEKSKVRIRE